MGLLEVPYHFIGLCQVSYRTTRARRGVTGTNARELVDFLLEGGVHVDQLPLLFLGLFDFFLEVSLGGGEEEGVVEGWRGRAVIWRGVTRTGRDMAGCGVRGAGGGGVVGTR